MNLLGPVMVDVGGYALTDDDRALLLNPLVGGVILFTRNFESEPQIYNLIKSIKGIRTPSLLVAIDHEGGRVQRFKNPFTTIPALNVLGRKYDNEPEEALKHAEIFGWLTSIELLAFNLDFSFTPVLDVDYGVSGVIGDRAFHSSPEAIAILASAYIKGMHEAGMASTGKHFPGHGGVSADSHTDMPVDERDLSFLLKNDIVPFKELIPDSLDGIMPAHVVYEKINKDPAGFSSFWLKDILRDKLEFKGVIFSDDLDMKGASCISEDYTTRAQAALDAGCDMVLVCNNRNAANEIVDNLDYNITKQTSEHLLKMRGHESLEWNKLILTDKWKHAAKVISEYN